MILSSRYDGKCKECWQPYAVGDDIAWDPDTRKAYHPECAPQGVVDWVPGGSSSIPHSSRPSRQKAKAYTPENNRDQLVEAILNALVALEAVIFLRSDALVTSEMEAGWAKYQKVKAMALAMTTEIKPEERAVALVAMRQALIEAIKIAF